MARKKQVPSVPADKQSDAFRSFFRKAGQVFYTIEPWVPWIVAGLYSITMAALTFHYHTVGGLDVETDFYAELYPQARKLVEGQFSPLNYGAKGPVYSILLAAVYLPVRDYFTAAQILNLFSGAVFLAILYSLIRLVFNSSTALLVSFLVVSNYMFQNFTYQVNSDIPFIAFCALTMYFLYRNGGTLDIVLSALFALLAFLTRYNGVFLVIGTAVFLGLERIPLKKRIIRIALWVGIFLAAGLPWFIPNWIATGNPVHNDNYINVMLEFYGHSEQGLRYERWTDALPKQFTGLGDIFFYDPVYFVKKTAVNVVGHFLWDMRALVQWRLGIFVMLGIPLFFLTKPDRQKLIFFSFGAVYFLILTLVFYNARFSLYLLVFYLPLVVLPFTNERITGRLGRFSRAPLVILVLLICSYAYTSTRVMLDDIQYTPFFLKDLGEALGKIEPDKTSRLLARKPHTAYYAGLTPVMFPDDVSTVDELVERCRTHSIKYIMYSLIEAKYRPQLRELLDVSMVHPGLEPVCASDYGVIYRVNE